MSSISGWQDPICYQFSFYAITDERECEDMLDVYHEFVQEMMPSISRWIELGGAILSKIHRPMSGYLMTEIRDEESLRLHIELLSSFSAEITDEIEISPFPRKVPRQFSASAKLLDKNWKEQAARFTDLKQISTIAKDEQIEWIDYLLNCPSDDLRGLCFPKKCYIPGSTPFTLHYQSIAANGTLAYAAELLQESGVVLPTNGSQKAHYIHHISISLPRYVLDEMGEAFSFQEIWKQRLERMARAYGMGIGLIKMDCYAAGRCHPLLSGCGNFKLGFSSRIHDVGWIMCLTSNQINLLGGMETLRSCDVFYSIDEQENGSAVLQLTSDVSVVPREKAKALWELISSHIELVEYQMNSLGDIPPSMRLGIPIECLKVNECGQYRFAKR